MGMNQAVLDELKEKQFRWDLHLTHKTVEEMMHLHRFIEVAEEAPEYVVVNEK